ncbi:Uncharacterised protein [Moraxella lacunata]|uniref:DUF4148 domain-containing protein n=1 Tax=Moraxella lacunata TaxID=477 RepID=A0A378QKL4_MORLA|nr:hypothetical protein [Moraxella lacunata]STZ00844.1 Uncharacterised protein [Moraxella lacunata]
MKKLSILALTATIAITPAFAEVNSYATPSVIQSAVSLDDIDTPATTSQADLSFAFDDVENLQVKEMTVAQMQETEGAVAPLVAVGVMTGTRFIAQRWVTQKVAQNMVKRGATNIMAPNRSVAKKIAGNNPIREYHAGPGSRYTHYHPNPRNGSHIWYGKTR